MLIPPWAWLTAAIFCCTSALYFGFEGDGVAATMLTLLGGTLGYCWHLSREVRGKR